MIISQNYAKAYTEILEIINYLPVNEYSKIPEYKIKYYQKNKDNNYKYKYDFNNPIYSRETAALIINLYRNYIASTQKKKIIDDILDLNLKQKELKKTEKYDKVDIFKTKNNLEKDLIKENAIIPYKKKNFILRILDRLKCCLMKK